MYDLADLVVKVQTDTGIATHLSDSSETSVSNINDLPFVVIGYHSVEVNDILGSGETVSPMVAYAESLYQFFFVQLNCKVTDFPSVWRQVHKAVSGYIPLPEEALYSGITPHRQFSKNVADGRILWLSFYRIEMPNVTQEV